MEACGKLPGEVGSPVWLMVFHINGCVPIRKSGIVERLSENFRVPTRSARVLLFKK